MGKDNTDRIDSNSRLALLLASAHLQTGDLPAATNLLQRAFTAGCKKSEAARILISGAYNSIGRAYALSGSTDKGYQHFINSIASGMPGIDAEACAQTRSVVQLGQLGLLPNTYGSIQKAIALASLEKIGSTLPPISSQTCATIDPDALSFYLNLGSIEKGAPPPFLLIESKSIPRSGLHYLKSTLSRLLGDHFSFCEWYQEPGCCKRHPCALTGFASYAQKARTCRIRLVKSHDFDHNDPHIQTGPHMQRLILIRDPLYVLTSWFELDELSKCSKLLMAKGIDIRKVWLMHEKELIQSGYEILEKHFVPPSSMEFEAWLFDKVRYMDLFIRDWVEPYIAGSDPYTQVVPYEEINRYVKRLVKPYRASLSAASAREFDEFSKRGKKNFVKRSDPFAVKVKCVEAYIRDKMKLFQEAAAHVVSREGFPTLGSGGGVSELLTANTHHKLRANP